MRYVIFNRKGGVGKSTIAVNLAAVAAGRGERTLLVDLDPQANATQYLLGRDAAAITPTIGTLFDEMLSFRLLGNAPSSTPERFAHPTPVNGLDLMVGDGGLMDLHDKLSSRHKIYKLRDTLAALDGYDTVVLDTPPALNFFTTSALIAADTCLIPFDCDDFSRRALYQLMGTVREMRDDHNPRLDVGGVIINFFQERARLPQQLVEELRAEGLPVLEPFLTQSVKVRESHQVHQPLVQMAPRHKLAERFVALYGAIQEACDLEAAS